MRLATLKVAWPAAGHAQPLALMLLFAAAMAAIPMGNPVWQDSDGMIGTLFSLQHLTLFFWGQDRFANLIPALASTVTSPDANLAVQVLLRMGLGVAAPLFAVLFLTEGCATAWRATLLSSALLLAFAPHLIQHELYVQASPYGTSFALAGLALLTLRRAGRQSPASATGLRLLAILLTLAAYLENISLVLIAGPLLAIEALLFGSGLAWQLGSASLLSLAASVAAMRMFGTLSPTSEGFAESHAGLVSLGQYLVGKEGRFPIAMVAGGITLHLLLRARAGRVGALCVPNARFGHWIAVAAVVACAAVAVFLSSWVVQNHAHPRYLLPTYIMTAGLGGAALAAFCRHLAPSWHRALELGMTGVLLASVALRSWPPVAPRLAEPARLQVSEAVAALVIARGLDGIEGGYWEVWPAVFQAERMKHLLGHPAGQVFGLTYRGEARRAAFIAALLERGEIRIGCIDPEPGHCNALVLATMAPPATAMHLDGPPVPLPGGGRLNFLTLQLKDRYTTAR